MRILGIDPGTDKSGVVLYDTDNPDKHIVWSNEMQNEELLDFIYKITSVVNDRFHVDMCAVEYIEGFGLSVGKDVFDTCVWIGRFFEAWMYGFNSLPEKVSRKDVKIIMCGATTVKNSQTGKRKAVSDALIRRAVIESFEPSGGGKTPQIGTKALQGPLYSVKGHCWQALAVVLTYLQMNPDYLRG